VATQTSVARITKKGLTMLTVKDCIEKIPHCLERDKELVEDIFNLPISESALREKGWVKCPSEEEIVEIILLNDGAPFKTAQAILAKLGEFKKEEG
jgi:hypothetical protein